MGPTWGRQDLGGSHVGPMNLAIRDKSRLCPLAKRRCSVNSFQYVLSMLHNYIVFMIHTNRYFMFIWISVWYINLALRLIFENAFPKKSGKSIVLNVQITVDQRYTLLGGLDIWRCPSIITHFSLVIKSQYANGGEWAGNWTCIVQNALCIQINNTSPYL